MARRNYLVEGLSGTGKSSVYEELIRRGYKALIVTVPGPTMPTLTPVAEVGLLVTTPGCGTNNRLSANSKVRNQRWFSSVGAAATATVYCPT